MSAFWEKYKDPRWQRKRLEVMQEAGFKCQHCGDGSKTLNVHHKSYRRGADPWDYYLLELHCLCEDCHEQWHRGKETLEFCLQYMGLDDYRELVGYAIGIALRTCPPDMGLSLRHEAGIVGLARAIGVEAERANELRKAGGSLFSGDFQELMRGADRP